MAQYGIFSKTTNELLWNGGGSSTKPSPRVYQTRKMAEKMLAAWGDADKDFIDEIVPKCENKLERVREWLELRGYLNEHDCLVLDPTEVGDLERILAKGGE